MRLNTALALPWVVASALVLSCMTEVVHAQAVTTALERPAVAARQAASAVLLGAAYSGARRVVVGERGIVVLSDDETHWQQAKVPVSVTLTAVRFQGAYGMAVGHSGSVLTSDDAGATWQLRLDGNRVAQLVLQGAQLAANPAALQAAQQFVADGPDKPLLDVLMLDAQRALVVGAYGLALATEDGGKSWASWMPRLSNPKGLHLNAVRSRGENIVVVGEQGLMLTSDDAGRHFRPLVAPYAGSFFTLELPSDGEIVVAGLRGNVWRSTDAGKSWLQLPMPMPVSVTGSTMRSDGSLLLVNQAGGVLTGRGGVFTPLKTPPLPPLNGVLAGADGTVLALSMRGVVSLPAVGATP